MAARKGLKHSMLALEGKPLGNYDVIRRIRVGGMGAVYEGRQRTAFGRRVAIKVILGDYASDPEMRRRFYREARTIAQLHHPHILPLIEFGDEQGLLYLVMPFIDGGTLTTYLRRNLPDLNDLTAIYLQLLDAVEYAHDQGLIHRDIKSSNVLLEMQRDGQPYVYLADFGLVRATTHSQTGEVEIPGAPIPLDQVPGTPHYMAPEQTRGIVTTSTDIYALGVLLYQMLTGELPYDDPDDVRVIQMHLYSPIPSPCDADASIPVELDHVVRTAMAKRAEDRFASVAELRKTFLAVMEGPVALPASETYQFREEVVPPARPIPSQKVPVPIPLRVGRAVTPPPSGGRQRVSASFPGQQQPPRRTSRNRRFTLAVVAATLIPALLLLLLLLPRMFGFSIFPSGVPVLGTASVAVVSVTPLSSMRSETYLLTASPKANGSDLETRTMQSRIVQATPKPGGNTVPTTGVKDVAATQASGTLLFQNGGNTLVTVVAQTLLTTSAGVQFQTTQPVDVPARQGGKDGTASAPAVAVNPGSAGNISANALSTTCCGDLTVSNPAAFTGGSDTHRAHVVAQADLDRVNSALAPGLEQQASQQLQSQLQPNEVMADTPTYDIVVTSDNPVGTQANQVTVQVTVTATAPVYDRDAANHLATQLLTQKATQTLGSHYQLQGNLTVDTPRVVAPIQKGTIYLSVSVHGFWVYQFSQPQMDQWRQSIKGMSSSAAKNYFQSQQGIASVQIQLPFGTDHLPSSTNQIKIVLIVHS
jgi:serine/threonine protein kinase